jgi:RNA polymerase sigma-70 factor (ECF subfamily)
VTSLSLLERIRGGDEDAWRRLVGLYTPLVAHWCSRNQLRGADADDIVQETFAAAASSIGRFRREQAGQTFRAWLRGIARNKILELYRGRGLEPPARGGSSIQQRMQEIPDNTAEAAEDPDDSGVVTDLFHRALELVRAEFESQTWKAFWGTAVEGRMPRDVGGDLGLSPNAVRTAKCRVLNRLRQEVGDLVD